VDGSRRRSILVHREIRDAAVLRIGYGVRDRSVVGIYRRSSMAVDHEVAVIECGAYVEGREAAGLIVHLPNDVRPNRR